MQIMDDAWVVLIESDWNLKYSYTYGYAAGQTGINRSRLEFKGQA